MKNRINSRFVSFKNKSELNKYKHTFAKGLRLQLQVYGPFGKPLGEVCEAPIVKKYIVVICFPVFKYF